MTNLEKYRNSFVTSFSISENDLSDSLEYNGIDAWDSIGHMTLVSNLESEFSISIDVDDILDFSSYKKGIELLKKYKVEMS